MRTFVWVNGLSFLLGVLVYAHYLSTRTYPRTEQRSARSDVIILLVNMALLIWSTVILFH